MIYQTKEITVVIRDLEIRLLQIENTDALYDALVAKGSDNEDFRDERIPYWADLWPSAIGLGEHLIKSQFLKPGISVHDMGCGLGLPGIIAGKLGASVIFTDYLNEALDFARQNWELNCATEASFKQMDWRKPESSLRRDLLIASDVAYERKSFDYLPEAFRLLVNPGGKIIISEPNRLYAQEFFDSLTFLEFKVQKFIYPVFNNNIQHRINVFEITLTDKNG